LQLVDLVRNGTQPRDMVLLVGTTRFVANNCQPFAQSGDKIDNHSFHQLESGFFETKA